MSTMPESVVLREFTADSTADTIKGASGVDLSDTIVGARLDDLRRSVSAGMRVFILDWEGDIAPLGVVIEGKEIGHALNGRLTSTDGRHIASYSRTAIYRGVSGRHHQMVIYII